jgi:hypothetical protein
MRRTKCAKMWSCGRYATTCCNVCQRPITRYAVCVKVNDQRIFIVSHTRYKYFLKYYLYIFNIFVFFSFQEYIVEKVKKIGGFTTFNNFIMKELDIMYKLTNEIKSSLNVSIFSLSYRGVLSFLRHSPKWRVVHYFHSPSQKTTGQKYRKGKWEGGKMPTRQS